MPDGSLATSAKPGDEINAKFEVKFPDSSGGETHTITFGPGAGAASINGGSVTVTDSSGNEVIYEVSYSAADGSYTFTHPNDPSQSSTLKPDEGSGNVTFDVGSTSSSVTVELNVTVASNDATLSADNAEVGMIDYGATATTKPDASSGVEYDADNNTAEVSGSATVVVDSVISNPGLNMGWAFENAAFRANEGANSDTGQNFYRRVDEVETLAANNVISHDRVQGAQEYTFQSSSKISIKPGTPESEKVTGMKLSFQLHDSENPEGTGQFMLGKFIVPLDTGNGYITVEYNGHDVLVKCEIDGNGKVTLTMLAGDSGADLSDIPLCYVPGTDGSSLDVPMDVAVAITNESNNLTQVFDNDGKPELSDLAGDLINDLPKDLIGSNDLSTNIEGSFSQPFLNKIPVDAVAAKPTFDDIILSSDGSEGDVTSLIPGKDINVKVPNIDLHGDVLDGSEQHLLFVTVPVGFGFTSITFTVNGTPYTLTSADTDFFSVSSKGEIRVEIDDFLKSQDRFEEKDLIEPFEADIKFENLLPDAEPPESTTIWVTIRTDELQDEITKDQDRENSYYENNTAMTDKGSQFGYSSATPGSITPDSEVYSNNTPYANEGNYCIAAGAPLLVTLGDSNDVVTDFNLSLAEDCEGMGSFLVFDTQEAYEAYLDYFKGDYPQVPVADAGETLESILDKLQSDFPGLIHQTNSVGIGDLNLTNGNTFGGQIVYVPSGDNYADADPKFDYNITVKDSASGQVIVTDDKSDPINVTTDAVANLPEVEIGQSTIGETITLGSEVEVTLKGTFYAEGDGSAEHFFLVEALPGWTVSYKDGDETKTVSPDDTIRSEDGTLYYKIPAGPDFETSHKSDASVDVTLTAPDKAFDADGNINNIECEIKTGTATIIGEGSLQGGEITYDNNIAINEKTLFDGKLTQPEGSGSGSGTGPTNPGEVSGSLVQNRPVYEDNMPNKNDGITDKVSGSLHYDSSNADTLTITVPAENGVPKFDLLNNDGAIGFTIDLATGNAVYVVKVSSPTNSGEIEIKFNEDYLKNGGSHTDTDVDISYEFTVTGGSTSAGGEVTVIVDAVADLGKIDEVTSIESGTVGVGKDSIAGNKAGDADDKSDDSVAYFKVSASFPDCDGSESHYLLIENVPSWQLANTDGSTVTLNGVEYDYSIVYLNGKSYYQIEIDGAGTNSTSQSFDVGMKFVGTNNAYDLDPSLVDPAGKDGVYDYKLDVGTLAVEKGGLDGNSTYKNDAAINVNVNVNDNVTLQYSPVDSDVKIKYPDTVWENDNIVINITDVETDKSDELTNIDITLEGASLEGASLDGGVLYFVKDGTLQELTGTPDPISKEVKYTVNDPDILDALANGTGHFEYTPPPFSHEDVTFQVDTTVRDTVSGAEKTFESEKEVIINAKADAAENVQSTVTDGTINNTTPGDLPVVVQGDVTFNVKAEFPDTVNKSESHYVILAELPFYYTLESITIQGDTFTKSGNSEWWNENVSIKYSSAGEPYYAVKVDHSIGEVSVDFNVNVTYENQDTELSVKSGTIVVDNTLNSDTNHQTDMGNSWAESINDNNIWFSNIQATKDDLVIQLEPHGENGYQLIIKDIVPEYNESAKYTIDGSNLDGGKIAWADADGVLHEVTFNDEGKYALDLDNTYYFIPSETGSSDATLGCEVTVRDNISGVEKTYDFSDLKLPELLSPETHMAVMYEDTLGDQESITLVANTHDFMENSASLHGGYDASSIYANSITHESEVILANQDQPRSSGIMINNYTSQESYNNSEELIINDENSSPDATTQNGSTYASDALYSSILNESSHMDAVMAPPSNLALDGIADQASASNLTTAELEASLANATTIEADLTSNNAEQFTNHSNSSADSEDQSLAILKITLENTN